MERTRLRTLVLLAVGTAAVGWLVLRVLSSRGRDVPAVPWPMVAVLVLLALVVFVMGWQVRQYLRGNNPALDPVRAARTAVLAKAACYAGALLTGWYAAQVLVVLDMLRIEAQRARAGAAALAVLGAVVLVAAGLLAEWFCRIPPPDDEGTDVARRGPEPDTAAG
jgi:hypothetical protein